MLRDSKIYETSIIKHQKSQSYPHSLKKIKIMKASYVVNWRTWKYWGKLPFYVPNQLERQMTKTFWFKVQFSIYKSCFITLGSSISNALWEGRVSGYDWLSGLTLFYSVWFSFFKEKGRREELSASNSLQYNLDQDYWHITHNTHTRTHHTHGHLKKLECLLRLL